MKELEEIYDALYQWCDAEGFAGWDPFDGLNSRYFRATPLTRFAPARLVFLQIVKRSPFNLRPLLGVAKGINPKGIALFALSETARFRTNFRPQHAENARGHLRRLEDLSIFKEGRRSWGYNFDWQSRAFFAPKGTPTVVPTAFAAQALAEGYRLFGDERYLEMLVETAEFVARDLNRVDESANGVSISYTPLDRSVIYNASLLAAEILANAGALAGRGDFTELAAKAANYVTARQREDGAWAYGPKLRHAWIDNFHTAFILLSLHRLERLLPGADFAEPIRRGIDFWLGNFFLPDGAAKYFDSRTYPIDIHSSAAAVAALSLISERDPRCRQQADACVGWMIANLRDETGYFHYQKRRRRTVKTPFIRWSNAWSAYALATYLETST